MAEPATERFTARADAYLSGRPGYPPSLVAHLEHLGALRPGAVVADVGVGTGLSAEPFLASGYAVVGVEPNAAMRQASVEALRRFKGYSTCAGRAEATGLKEGSVDLVLAAQAFHWFDVAAFRAEARRILKAGAWAALVWNDRDVASTPFLAGYEALMIAHGRDYPALRRRHHAVEPLADFFGGEAPAPAELRHLRRLDWPTLADLAASSSYLPARGHLGHEGLMAELSALFQAHEHEGLVEMHLVCRVHAARLG